MNKSRRHFMKSALVAGGIALGGTGVFLMVTRDNTIPAPALQGMTATQAVRDVINDYNGPDDPAALQALVAKESQDQFTMVMYHASWCPHCSKLTAQMHGASALTDAPYKVIKVDVERFPGLSAAAKQTDGVPETFVFLNGQQIDHFGGAARDDRMIADYLKALTERYPAAAVTKPFITTPTPFPKAH